MNKVRAIFAAITLLLVTAVVFSEEANFKYTNSGVYYTYGDGYYLLSATPDGFRLSIVQSGESPAAIGTSQGAVYMLYSNVTGASYAPLFTQGY